MQAYSSQMLLQIKRHIRNGGVIAYPTEYCYGLGCDPFNQKAINKILEIKRRSRVKGLIVIAGKMNQLDNLILPLSIKDQERIKQYWPGFYSIILDAKPLVPKVLIGKHNKLAVRVSKHILVKQLCNYVNSALVSTSANRAGFKPVKDYRECIRQFGREDIMILPGTTRFKKHPSTVIDWASSKILR